MRKLLLFKTVLVILMMAFAQFKPVVAQQMPMPEKDVKSVAPVTFEELKKFVRDWRRYNVWLKKEGAGTGAVLYLDVVEQTDYPEPVLAWLDKNGWTADRFFFIERRLKETLSAMQMEDKRNTFIETMQRQIRSVHADTSLKDDAKKERIKQFERTIVDQTRMMAFSYSVTKEELNLFRINRKALENVLNL